mgnify:CR=1 FL=1
MLYGIIRPLLFYQRIFFTVVAVLLDNNIDGVIATNTTLSREGVEGLEFDMRFINFDY